MLRSSAHRTGPLVISRTQVGRKAATVGATRRERDTTQGKSALFSTSASDRQRGNGSSNGAWWVAAAAAAPLVAAAVQAQRDPDGFKENLRKALPAGIARQVLASQENNHADPQAPEARRLALATAPVYQGISSVAVAEAATATAEDKSTPEEREAKLYAQIQGLEKEREKLAKEGEELRKALLKKAPAPDFPQPTVVFQEIAMDEDIKRRLADLQASKTSAKVVDSLEKIAAGHEGAPSKSITSGSVGETGVDLKKEKVLSKTATVPEAKERLRQLLIELHSRTRMEGVHLREAIRQTEDAAQVAHLRLLAEHLAAQERELQRLMEDQVKAICKSAEEEMVNRDAAYDQKIREDWVKVNERAEGVASHMIRMKHLQDTLESERVLERERLALKACFDKAGNLRSATIEELNLRVQSFNDLIVQDAEEARASSRLQALLMATASVNHCLNKTKPMKDAMEMMKKLGDEDPLVKAALDSIPKEAGSEGIASARELCDRFAAANFEARRRLLVPDGGGIWMEMVGWGLAKGQGLISWEGSTVPEGQEPEKVLQRAKRHVEKAELAQAVAELSNLSGRPAEAMSGWVDATRRRLVVEQAHQLMRAHAAAISASLPKH